MKRVVVMAFEDRSHPEGGHATLLLVGVARLPEPVSFELRLIDPVGTDDAGLIGDDVESISARLTGEGLEFAVGPDMTEMADLTTGTAVEIIVRSLGIKGEFLWPDIAPRARPKRRTKVARVLPQSRSSAPQAGMGMGIVIPDQSVAAREGAISASASGLAQRAVVGMVTEPALGGATRRAEAPDTSDAVPAAFASAAAARNHVMTSATPSVTGRAPERPAVAAREGNPEPPARPHDRGAKPPIGGSWAGFAALVVAGMLAVQATAWLAIHTSTQGAPGFKAMASPGTRAGDAGIGTSGDLFDLLAVGTRSPAGIDAAGIAGDAALVRAAESLQGVAERRDTAEGAYWIRRYLAERIGDPRVMRALTQLGSTHAEPSAGAPEYIKAQRLWEIAAAYGDPVAMCFLATLKASGLGGPADRAAADRWTAAATVAGGCSTTGAASLRKP